MLASVGEEILARMFTNLDSTTYWSGEEPGAYVSIDRNGCENLSLTLGTHRAIVKGFGIYISIGLRKEWLRELTANL